MCRIAVAALLGLALWAPSAQGAGTTGAPVPAPTCPATLKRQVAPLSAPWALLSDDAEEYLVLTSIVIHGDQFGCGYAPALPGSVEIGQPHPADRNPGAPVRILYTPAGLHCRGGDDSPWTPQPTQVCNLAASACSVTCTQ